MSSSKSIYMCSNPKHPSSINLHNTRNGIHIPIPLQCSNIVRPFNLCVRKYLVPKSIYNHRSFYIKSLLPLFNRGYYLIKLISETINFTNFVFRWISPCLRVFWAFLSISFDSYTHRGSNPIMVIEKEMSNIQLHATD